MSDIKQRWARENQQFPAWPLPRFPHGAEANLFKNPPGRHVGTPAFGDDLPLGKLAPKNGGDAKHRFCGVAPSMKDAADPVTYLYLAFAAQVDSHDTDQSLIIAASSAEKAIAVAFPASDQSLSVREGEGDRQEVDRPCYGRVIGEAP